MTELPSCNLEAMLSHVCTGQARSRGIRISYLMYWVCPWEAPCYKIGVASTHNPRNVISQSISSSACLKSTPFVLPPLPSFSKETMPPPKKVDPPHKMVLTTNSLRNTTIAVDDDALYYEIVTRFWHPHLTKIKKLDEDTQEMVTIAELEREPGREPRLRFGGENAEWINAKDWLHNTPEKV